MVKAVAPLVGGFGIFLCLAVGTDIGVAFLLIAALLFLWGRARKATAPEPPPRIAVDAAPPPQAWITAPIGAGLATFLDVETTGLDAYRDEIIELGVSLFAFDRMTGQIHGVVDEYCGLREPTCPIQPGAQAVNGITWQMVSGRTLDHGRIRAILDRGEFIVAHNASFDRKFVCQMFPEAHGRSWLCSMRHIDWWREGVPDRKLQSILLWHGIQAGRQHRADSDVAACVQLLGRSGKDGVPFLGQLLRVAPKVVSQDLGRGGAHSQRVQRQTLTIRLSECGVDLEESGPPDPAPSQPAADPQRCVRDLMDLLQSMLADGVVDLLEAEELARWLLRHRDLQHVWPVNVLTNRVKRILADGEVDQDELADLRVLFQQITHPEAIGKLPADVLTGIPFTRPEPEIRFQGRQFVFTGLFMYGTRQACESATVNRRGVCQANVTRTTDIVVVGSMPTKDWAHGHYGRKIESAVRNIQNGAETVIVSEEHWTKCLQVPTANADAV